MEPIEGRSSSLGRKARSTIKEVGLMEFRFQPDLFERSPDRYPIRICYLAAANC
jgi:hypothetical protein